MKTFFYRFKLYLFDRKCMSWNFLCQLTAMDLGRWIFRKAHICNICGSPNVVGYKCDIGLHCFKCWDR